jgi:hypothetical protein
MNDKVEAAQAATMMQPPAEILAMPGPEGVLARLAFAWPVGNLGAWMVGESKRGTPAPDLGLALANLMSSVIWQYGANTSDHNAAIFGREGVLPFIEKALQDKQRRLAASKRNGIILPGLGG